MNLDEYLNNLGYSIAVEFKENRVFKKDGQIPMNIINEPPLAGQALYNIITSHNQYFELLNKIRITWLGLINQELLNNISLYEQKLNEKNTQERIQKELYAFSEQYRMETDYQDINKLLGSCSIQQGSVESLADCLSKSSIKNTGPSRNKNRYGKSIHKKKK